MNQFDEIPMVPENPIDDGIVVPVDSEEDVNKKETTIEE